MMASPALVDALKLEASRVVDSTYPTSLKVSIVRDSWEKNSDAKSHTASFSGSQAV